MAEHEIRVDVAASDSDVRETNSQFRALAGVLQRFNPAVRDLMGQFRALLRISDVFGTNLAALTGAGGAITATITVFKMLRDAAEQVAEQFQKASEAFYDTFQELSKQTRKGLAERAKNGDLSLYEQGVAQMQYDSSKKRTEELRGAAGAYLQAAQVKDPVMQVQMLREQLVGILPQDLLSKPTDKNNVGDVMKEIGDYIKTELKKSEDETRDYAKILDNQKKAEEAAGKEAAKGEKELVQGIIDAAKQALREGEYEIAEIIADKQEELDEKKDQEEEDKKSMTLLSNAPMGVQDEIRNAGRPETMLVRKRDSFIRDQLNSLDRIGGYTSNLVNAQTSPELTEMKKQSAKLEQIAENTKKTSARYAG